ncbi:MAG: methyltransferase domain-containing protein [Deltaproteobacteria bacterium]|nr:methyltransferase domain-containing protein [Deltaproteobacteria bacterium]
MTTDEITPGQLLNISGSYWQACTLHAGVRLEIFTVIGEDRVSGEEIARRLAGDVRGVTTLLNALAAMGLLTKQGEQYANTEMSKTFLVKGSPRYIGYILMHHHYLVESWSRLHEAVTSGSPVRERPHDNDEKRRESFLMGMFNLGMGLAPRVASQINLDGRHHLLDLGGGPGTYAIHFCLANPELKGTVYDLATTRPFALRTIEQFGLADRIDFMAGNYLENHIEGSYDVAWLSHILHGESPEECQDIIRKVVAVLEPGGLILIHDFILENTLDGPLFPALFSLNMLLGTRKGRSYAEKQIMEMLDGAGVREIRRISFQGPNDSGIIVGHV